jgi:uncharacterized protein (TIGR02145 family)
MKKTVLLIIGLAYFTIINQAQTVVDYDGNVYNTVTIGIQTWLKENLKVTHYNNGDAIPEITDNHDWAYLPTGTGAYCNYHNNADTASIFGRLYNWYAVNDSRNICPVGWHVAQQGELKTLSNYLGGDSVTGGKLKENGYIHWASPNTGATNESGFTALPAGDRTTYGGFENAGYFTVFWTSTLAPLSGAAWACMAGYNSKNLRFYAQWYNNGFSVRCVSYLSTKINETNYQGEVKIFPNPALDKIYINCAEKQYLKIQIYNLIGECILQKELNSNTNEIDINSLSKGVYVVKITGDNWSIQRKLIKE